MIRKAILIMAIVLAIGAGIGTGYALWGGTHYVFPPPPSISEGEPSEEQTSSRTGVIAEESFMLKSLVSMTESEIQELGNIMSDESYGDSAKLPFTMYTLHYNKIFLKKGEAVQFIVRSSEPMGPDLVNEEEGLEVMYAMPYIDPLFNPHSNEIGYYEQLKRSDGFWEISETFTCEANGMFFIYIENEARNDAWCQYAVILK